MSSSSTPGLDGFGGGFYKSCWSIIKQDIIASVQFFFVHGDIPDNFNPFNVCLIPKTDNADMVQKYRPIAVANFEYKIITMTLENRLATIAADRVSPQKEALIKGR